MMRQRMEKSQAGTVKFRSSLMSRYLLIIFGAFLFIPFIFILISIVYIAADYAILGNPTALKYGNAAKIEAAWHREASAIGSTSAASDINNRLRELKQQYPEALMFWVDSAGRTQLQLPPQPALPAEWQPADAIRYMKSNSNGDPFTVVAFIGAEQSSPAFMVMQLPRELLQGRNNLSSTPVLVGIISIMFIALMLLSLLFFIRLRKRLSRLQAAMTDGGAQENGIPLPVAVTKPDEIGQLETAFNRMVAQLEVSQQREWEEEALRKRLVSNLSHDLRTPLTVINSHLYSLRKEQLSPAGQDSIHQMEMKMEGLSHLIDNLMSYTLMASGRYPLRLEPVDVIRIVRESAAAWYPAWEKEGIEADVDLPEQPLIWKVDKEGFRRILDNLFQNVIRHAAQGGYIGLSTVQLSGRTALVISDRGPGTDSPSELRGAGIGIAIVDHLAGEMGLHWHAEENKDVKGTRIILNEI